MTETPIKNKLLSKVKSLSIPPSPMMKTLGYGTGVTVYKLERSPSRSPWVLKRISKRNINETMNLRLKCEAAVLRKLNHANIVGFRALLSEKDGRHCIAMEDCTVSLGDMIENRVEEQNVKPFPAENIKKFMSDISNALDYLHREALILHCDIKSYNVLVKENFSICKLCDFGVSFPLKADGTVDESKAGTEVECVGTPCWMAPELLGEDQLITTKIDIYAYGLVIWEMIALTPPNSEDVECSEIDSILEDSDADDSILDKNLNDNYGPNRQRPAVPCEFLDDSYLPILSIYYICTENDYNKRPSADKLKLLVKEMENNAPGD